jgi:hypothetical protein
MDSNQDDSETHQDPLLLEPAFSSSSYGAIHPNQQERLSPNHNPSPRPRSIAPSQISHSYSVRPHDNNRHQNPTGILSVFQQSTTTIDDSEDPEDSDDDDDDDLLYAKDRLLNKADTFTLQYSPERGYRATEMNFCSMSRPHMRAMHASWICFFASYFVQFAMAPLLPQLQISFNLTKRDIWWTNVWMMMGGIPMRFLLGPLCDTYGPRVVMVWMVALCAIPCALSGVLVSNLGSLVAARFIMGAMDAFVPCQC